MKIRTQTRRNIEKRMKLIRADFQRLDTERLRQELFNRQSGKCFWYELHQLQGESGDLTGFSGVEAEIDHYATVYEFAARYDMSDKRAVEQANAETNLMLVHPSCNHKRSNRDPEEFREDIQTGKVALDEQRKLTPEEIEEKKQSLSERNRKAGRKGGLEAANQHIGVHGRSKNQRSKDSRKGGHKSAELGVGIHGRSKKQHSEDARKTVELSTGLFGRSKTQRSKDSRKGGRKGGRQGMHIRWHVQRGKPNSECRICRKEGLLQTVENFDVKKLGT